MSHNWFVPIPPRLQDFLDALSILTDRQERIQALIGVAERFKQVPTEIAQPPYDESHRVPGCESEAFAWVSQNQEGRPQIYFAVENPQGISAKAFAVILQENLSGATPDQIAHVPDEVVYEIFGRELSMGKSLGLIGMLRMVKQLVREFKAHLKSHSE